jgi:hypothetical protein
MTPDDDEVRHEYGLEILSALPEDGGVDAVILAVPHKRFEEMLSGGKEIARSSRAMTGETSRAMTGTGTGGRMEPPLRFCYLPEISFFAALWLRVRIFVIQDFWRGGFFLLAQYFVAGSNKLCLIGFDGPGKTSGCLILTFLLSMTINVPGETSRFNLRNLRRISLTSDAFTEAVRKKITPKHYLPSFMARLPKSPS